MVTQTTREPTGDKSFPDLGSELWALVLGYVKQETLTPLKALGRYVALGVAGSFVLAIGLVLLDVAGLRAMQENVGVFQGAHSWMPYAVCGLGTLIAMALAGLGALKGRRA